MSFFGKDGIKTMRTLAIISYHWLHDLWPPWIRLGGCMLTRFKIGSCVHSRYSQNNGFTPPNGDASRTCLFPPLWRRFWPRATVLFNMCCIACLCSIMDLIQIAGIYGLNGMAPLVSLFLQLIRYTLVQDQTILPRHIASSSSVTAQKDYRSFTLKNG